MIKNKFCLQFMMVVMVLNLETFNVHSSMPNCQCLHILKWLSVGLISAPFVLVNSTTVKCSFSINFQTRAYVFCVLSRRRDQLRIRLFFIQRKCQRTSLLTLYQNIYRCSFKKIFIAVDIFLKLRSFILLKNIITNL
jgi:hypothetical protein